MERWPAGRAPSRRRDYDHPSFSSTLLDAIYRSIDDECAHDGAGAARRDDRRCSSVPAAPEPYPGSGKLSASAMLERRTPIATSGERRPANRRRPIISTSSSSDNSSYGGFSSSEPESTATPHPAVHLRPIRTVVSPAASVPARPSGHPRGAASALPPRSLRATSQTAGSAPIQQVEEKSNSIRSKLRDLRKSGTPASPGARIAGFLNSLFASAAGNPRKHKTNSSSSSSSPAVLVGGVGDESACSTASSYSRSCLSKTTPSSRGRTAAAQQSEAAAKRSVRFYPVSVIVGEDLRPCGQKSVYKDRGGGGDRDWTNLSAPTATAERRGAAAKKKKRVEELLRGRQDQEEEEVSDASSDLFELEDLAAVGRGIGYRDELPVYETTTYLTSNRPIYHNLII